MYVDDPATSTWPSPGGQRQDAEIQPLQCQREPAGGAGVAADFLPRIGAVFAAKGWRCVATPRRILPAIGPRKFSDGAIKMPAPLLCRCACAGAGLVAEATWPHHQREGWSMAWTLPSPTSTVQQPPHRRHRHQRPPPCPGFFAQGGLQQRDGQCPAPALPTDFNTGWAPRSASAPTSSSGHRGLTSLKYDMVLGSGGVRG